MYGESLKVAVEPVVYTPFNYSFVLVKVFKFGSFHGFLDNDLLQDLLLFDESLESWVVGSSHPLLALRAVQVVEYYTWSIIFFLDKIFYTVVVENMATLEMHARSLS